MTTPTNISASALSAPNLSPETKAALVWSDMRQEMLRQLWQAALGDANGSGSPAENGMGLALQFPGIDPSVLLALQGAETAAPSGAAGTQAASGISPFAFTGENGELDLKDNAVYQPLLEAAGARTGLPPSMLASIINAEAATRNGVWDPNSRNPRSTAAGLTQFLASTWESETERPGTWLNSVAAERGWLNAKGRVRPEAREQLLALRFDPRASIEAAADYALANLRALEKQGLVHDGLSAGEMAKRAYIAHHLGAGDAARFLTGGLAPARARALLASQIGGAAAAARIQSAGNATAAHRQWLTAYVDSKIRVDDHQRRTITV